MNIDEVLQSHCSTATDGVPGVVALGLNRSDITYTGAAGYADISESMKVTVETPHTIMSMTKPITSFAIMMLVEQGLISLDEPATTYVPAYADIKVMTNIDRAGKTCDFVSLKRPFTVRELLAHTAGFGYAFCNEDLFAFQPDSDSKMFGLVHQPGEAWIYSLATEVLGDIVMAVTGMGLFDALNQLIFSPLGMQNTHYGLAENMARPHVPDDEGNWQGIDRFDMPERGDGGLVSTINDYAKFVSCLLNDGVPLMQPTTFAQMISNQIGNLVVTEQPAANPMFTFPFPSGGGRDKFGLGFQIHHDIEPGMRNDGSYSWCGLLNTFFWGDPVTGTGGIVFMQVLPLYHPGCIKTLRAFEQALYQT